MDGPLWRTTLLAAVDTVSDDAVIIKSETDEASTLGQSRIPEDIRTRFRDGPFASVELRGLYSICEYSHLRDLCLEEYDADPRVQIALTGGKELIVKHGEPQKISPAPHQEDAQTPYVEEERDGKPEVAALDTTPIENIEEDRNEADEAQGLKGMASEETQGSDRLGKFELDRRYQIILDTFGQYGVKVGKTDAGVEHAIEGPASILFRVRPGTGVLPKKLTDQKDALKLALELESSQDMRFDIDRGYVTIDVPKLDADRYFIEASDMWVKWQRPEIGLTVPLGEDRLGKIVDIDFTSTNSPHLLLGGTTGSGKSEALNTILGGLIKYYTPQEVMLHLIDPKGTELQHLSEAEHICGEIGWDEEDAVKILARAVEEMLQRSASFKKIGVKTVDEFNAQANLGETIPRWVIVLDEYADITSNPDAKKDIEGHLRRLAQRARAAGIHVIIATQKPDASVISTNLRSNLPAQLALKVKSVTESRVIMDDSGAEALAGKGDAFLKVGGVITRVQCAKI